MGDDNETALDTREVQREVEVLDDQVIDRRDAALLPHPGEEEVAEPVEELLGVRSLTTSEPVADELDVTDDALELAEPDDEERAGYEPSLEEELDHAEHRQELEVRFETLEDERTALDALEPRDTVPAADDLLCSRCHLWKNRAQFLDSTWRICRDCA